jgi:hypothetical protein
LAEPLYRYILVSDLHNTRLFSARNGQNRANEIMRQDNESMSCIGHHFGIRSIGPTDVGPVISFPSVCRSTIGIESKSLQTGRNRAEARPLRRKAPASVGGRYNSDRRRGDLSMIWGTNGERRSYHLQSVRVCSLLWSPEHEK